MILRTRRRPTQWGEAACPPTAYTSVVLKRPAGCDNPAAEAQPDGPQKTKEQPGAEKPPHRNNPRQAAVPQTRPSRRTLAKDEDRRRRRPTANLGRRRKRHTPAPYWRGRRGGGRATPNRTDRRQRPAPPGAQAASGGRPALASGREGLHDNRGTGSRNVPALKRPRSANLSSPGNAAVPENQPADAGRRARWFFLRAEPLYAVRRAPGANGRQFAPCPFRARPNPAERKCRHWPGACPGPGRRVLRN